MDSAHASRSSERFATSLHGRVLAQGRSFPVTITALSHEGLAAEGSELTHLLGAFIVVIALESSGDTSWSPKAGGPQYLHLFSAAAESESHGSGEGRLSAVFTDMAEPARRLLEAYIGQISRGRAARSAGGVFSRPPEQRIDLA